MTNCCVILSFCSVKQLSRSFAWLPSGFDVTRTANILWTLLHLMSFSYLRLNSFSSITINADVNRDLGLFQIHGEEPWGTPRGFSSSHQQSECHTSMNHTPATVRKQTIDPCCFASEQEKHEPCGCVCLWRQWLIALDVTCAVENAFAAITFEERSPGSSQLRSALMERCQETAGRCLFLFSIVSLSVISFNSVVEAWKAKINNWFDSDYHDRRMRHFKRI